mmetsp:Transcript_1854/g.4076  ORF Transcript_1854/g.4076 Transcript_1854/m.4076 type:complete len:342 (+) Transcript_1854:89-1114(+)|eukprot:scaffold46247_cov199-Amphora_coffeaeformis.AAC.3
MFNHAPRLSRAPRTGKMDKPKRPLSAYNLFFQDERVKLLESLPQPKTNKNKKSHGKIGFAGLARTLADKWKVANESTKLFYEELAAKEKRQYALHMVKWAQEREEESRSSSNHGADIQMETQATRGMVPVSGSTENKQEQNFGYADSNQQAIKEESPVMDPLLVFQDSGDNGFQKPPFDMSRQMTNQDASRVSPYEVPEEIPSWSQTEGKANAVPESYNSFHSSESDSSQVVNAFLEQPGMADFITHMYSLLSQKTNSGSHSQPCQNFARWQTSNTNPLTLPQLPFESQGQMHVPDMLLGNIAPLERETEEFPEDDATLCFGDVFETTGLPNQGATPIAYL